MKITSADFVTSATNLDKCPAGSHPEVALAGRSNVGKSSLFNVLVNRKRLARTSNTPGRTQLINFFIINDKLHLVDLPGYGFAKVPVRVKAQWGKMIEGYLAGREQLRGVILLVDVRHKPTQDDQQMYNWLKAYRIPTAVVATKADKLSRGRAIQNLAVVRKNLQLADADPLVLFSAVTGQGKEDILTIIKNWTMVPGVKVDS
ncbi:ribosome biogenesis GTP-binding protein YihA/YsxC [Desulfoscipio gibsoniae]|uniref:Probable GTP-binding protein EngB n=1 Tax=Desulfoscipio gibsoniae DSM 7213 TaxID=767817 RepID=R4KHH8_9FIRM|nr:ribosome biogenesis GTP-binding protein YihA/YsxC [Desulfoscipio gibsoniae]AGL02668.1 ribosome biogenesis GTP-binding protein YsxC/EngB [Desulfoscipio gibsoniae DSM 7213]